MGFFLKRKGDFEIGATLDQPWNTVTSYTVLKIIMIKWTE